MSPHQTRKSLVATLLPDDTGASSVGLARCGFKGWLWSKEQQQDEKALSPALLLPPKPSTSSAMLRREQRLTVSRLR